MGMALGFYLTPVFIMLCKICDCVVEIKPLLQKTENFFKDYIVSSGEIEFIIETSADEIKEYASRNSLNNFTSEVTLILEKFSKYAFKKGVILFHSSAIFVGDDAILFAAPSGTGKSTHSSLWIKNFNDVEYVNDDKPFIKRDGDNYLIYGSPWRGKHMLGNDVVKRVKAICFIERAKENSIKKISKVSAIGKLVNQSYGRENTENFDFLLQFFASLVNFVDIYLLSVNMDDSAVIMARNTILGDINEN